MFCGVDSRFKAQKLKKCEKPKFQQGFDPPEIAGG
jgi:hypothetical protein